MSTISTVAGSFRDGQDSQVPEVLVGDVDCSKLGSMVQKGVRSLCLCTGQTVESVAAHWAARQCRISWSGKLNCAFERR